VTISEVVQVGAPGAIENEESMPAAISAIVGAHSGHGADTSNSNTAGKPGDDVE
jgi:hypothetical protein